MKTTNKYYDRLIELKDQFPELTFDNNGYEYLKKEIQESHKEQIEEIKTILKETIEGFVSFNHFKPRNREGFDIRCQYKWDARFVGVGYFDINLFKEFKID